MIDKIIDAVFDVLETLWNNKRKDENKKKSWKQWWKDWRAEVKRQKEEYKKLSLWEKWKLGFKDFGKKMWTLFLTSALMIFIIIVLSEMDWLDDFEAGLEWTEKVLYEFSLPE
jgi:hypothetical protein